MVENDVLITTGDRIVYIKDGNHIEDNVVGVTGSRLWLESGYVTYRSHVVSVV